MFRPMRRCQVSVETAAHETEFALQHARRPDSARIAGGVPPTRSGGRALPRFIVDAARHATGAYACARRVRAALGLSGSRALGFSGSQALGASGPRAIRFSGAASPAPPLSGSRTSRRSRDRFRPRAASRPSSRPARVRPARHSHFVGHARRQASARRMRRQPAETGRRRMFNASRRPACPARASRAQHRSPSRRRARESG